MTESAASKEKHSTPTPGRGLPPGMVQVSVMVPAPLDEVWTSLTRRDSLSQWFGDISESFKPGGTYRLDFGDGDFFEIVDVNLLQPTFLSYHWRFLGTSPKNSISWSIVPLAEQCRVTVTDADSSRMPDTVAELTEGWTDFLTRLQAYCASGQNSRYLWRKEFDGSIELQISAAQAFDILLSAEGLRRWMPWSAAAIAPGTQVTMTDHRRPAQFVIGTVDQTGASSLRFALDCPEWCAATECTVKTQPWPRGSLLLISHNGWQAISPHEIEQAAQRTRFGTLWTQALHSARQFVNGGISAQGAFRDRQDTGFSSKRPPGG